MNPLPPHLRAGRCRAFTLIELLVVIAIIVILTVLVVPAFTNIKTGADVTSAANTIKGVLEQARTYAMANNTFVWVGVKEVDISKDATISPQTAGTGRIALAAIASRNGTRGYDVTASNLADPAWPNYATGTQFIAVDKLQHVENVHLATTMNGLGNQPPTSGNMARPYIQSNYYVIGNAFAVSVTPFDYPLGSALSTGQYSFRSVLNFDPQGVARIQYATNNNYVASYIEIGLQQTHGATISSSPNVVAIQINCVTGATHIYRP